jgi:hypothetical protein
MASPMFQLCGTGNADIVQKFLSKVNSRGPQLWELFEKTRGPHETFTEWVVRVAIDKSGSDEV